MISPGVMVILKGGGMLEASQGAPCYEGRYLDVTRGTIALVVFSGPCDCGKCCRSQGYRVLANGRIIHAYRRNFKLLGPQLTT